MAILIIPDKGVVNSNFIQIQAYLNERGIMLEKWQASEALPKGASQEAILNAFAHVLKPFMSIYGYQSADVISVYEDTEGLQGIRDKFLSEHTHSENEIRFFVEGQGYFWFNLEGHEPVFCLKCEQGDFLSVPAGKKHWFDLGPEPHVVAIRIFSNTEGWVPNYTHSQTHTMYDKQLAYQ